MSAVRLEVETHIVTASATAVQNLTKCVTAADVKIDELVAAGLASAEAVLSPTERDLGVAVADIGAGTIDLTLFVEGSPFHTAVLPVGGANVTNDVAIGLKTSLHVAEALKVDHGTCDLAGVDPDEVISVTVLGDEAGRTVERLEVCRIIEARMRETFEMLRTEILAAAPGMLPAGLVLTGGGAQLAGAAVLGRDVLEMPVRVAAPSDVGGLVDGLLEPGSATAIGLLLWGARHVAASEMTTYDSAPGGGLAARFRNAHAEHLPVASRTHGAPTAGAATGVVLRASRTAPATPDAPLARRGYTPRQSRSSAGPLAGSVDIQVTRPTFRARSPDGRPVGRAPPEDERCRCGRIRRTSRSSASSASAVAAATPSTG